MSQCCPSASYHCDKDIMKRAGVETEREKKKVTEKERNSWILLSGVRGRVCSVSLVYICFANGRVCVINYKAGLVAMSVAVYVRDETRTKLH